MADEVAGRDRRDYPGNRRRLSAYGIQYLGIERDGRRLVYANGFCDWEPPLASPDTAWVSVFDGGASLLHEAVEFVTWGTSDSPMPVQAAVYHHRIRTLESG